jgi:hypothetical protein
MRRKRSRKPSAAKVAAPAGAAGLAATALWRVVRRRRAAGPAGSPPPEEAPSAMREWSCECGQRFRVSGEDRHRVFWLEDASDDDPVLGDQCPSCERSLTAQEASA